MRPSPSCKGGKWLCATLAAALALGLAASGGGCATARSKSASRPSPPQPYLRVDRAPDGTLSLQVALRQFSGPRRASPKIWLAGVAHVGESNYFAALQQHLDQCALVLYEGIGGKPQPPAPGEQGENQASLQSRLARALGLVFQLEAINYDRSHWKNSDLSLEQLERLFRQAPAAQPSDTSALFHPLGFAGAVGAPGDGAARGMEELLGIMDGTSFMGVLAHTLVQMVAASPRLQATVKVVLIETMGAIEGDIAQAGGLPPNLKELLHFLIRERNKVVLADLQSVLAWKKPPATIAVFYGAGHMHDLEARLTSELGYRPSHELWLTAFSINPREAGISELELSFLRGLIHAQMQQLQRGWRE